MGDGAAGQYPGFISDALRTTNIASDAIMPFCSLGYPKRDRVAEKPQE